MVSVISTSCIESHIENNEISHAFASEFVVRGPTVSFVFELYGYDHLMVPQEMLFL